MLPPTRRLYLVDMSLVPLWRQDTVVMTSHAASNKKGTLLARILVVCSSSRVCVTLNSSGKLLQVELPLPR